ncbi:hypothetical protein GEMRC1_001178 [Eukaryota sp. GEM-RC1]
MAHSQQLGAAFAAKTVSYQSCSYRLGKCTSRYHLLRFLQLLHSDKSRLLDERAPTTRTRLSHLLTATKCDLVSEVSLPENDVRFSGIQLYKTSAKEGDGVSELFRSIVAQVPKTPLIDEDNCILRVNYREESSCKC